MRELLANTDPVCAKQMLFRVVACVSVKCGVGFFENINTGSDGK